MEETEILCPNCYRVFLVTEDGVEAHCIACGSEFEIIAPNTVKYN